MRTKQDYTEVELKHLASSLGLSPDKDEDLTIVLDSSFTLDYLHERDEFVETPWTEVHSVSKVNWNAKTAEKFLRLKYKDNIVGEFFETATRYGVRYLIPELLPKHKPLNEVEKGRF